MLITCTKVLKGLAFWKIVTSTVIYSSAASQCFCPRCIQTELLMHVDALRCYNQASLSQNKHNQTHHIVFRAPPYVFDLSTFVSYLHIYILLPQFTNT